MKIGVDWRSYTGITSNLYVVVVGNAYDLLFRFISFKHPTVYNTKQSSEKYGQKEKDDGILSAFGR